MNFAVAIICIVLVMRAIVLTAPILFLISRICAIEPRILARANVRRSPVPVREIADPGPGQSESIPGQGHTRRQIALDGLMTHLMTHMDEPCGLRGDRRSGFQGP